jgi:hypothetical protein
VERAAPLAEEPAVRHLLGERVLEGVLGVGVEARLVEELPRLEMGQAPAKVLLRQLGDGPQQGQRHLLADDGGLLQELSVLDREPVHAGGEHRLDRGRHPDLRQRDGQAVATALAREGPGLDEGAHALLQEERVALGAVHQPPRERDGS